MARGMPMRPPQPPPRRPAQPPRQQPRQPPKQQPRQPQRTPPKTPGPAPGEQQRRLLEQQRRVVEQQQRRAAAAKSAQAQRNRQRQGVFLHEAHGARRREDANRLTDQVRAQADELASILEAGLARSPQLDLSRPDGDGASSERLGPPDGDGARPDRLSASAGGARLDRIARIAARLRERDPAAVESFVRTVLRRIPLPAGFPRRADVAYYPEEERVVVRLVLPGREVVPEASEYEYLATPDEIHPVPLPAGEAAELYELVVAQVALLVVRDVLAAEPRLAAATFHGLVAEPACLVSLTVDRDTFAGLDLAEMSPVDCLDRIGARRSPEPYAYAPAAERVAEPATPPA